jgi:hypothetical protein
VVVALVVFVYPVGLAGLGAGSRCGRGRGRASCRISIGAGSTVEVPESTNHSAGFVTRHASAGVSTRDPGCRR